MRSWAVVNTTGVRKRQSPYLLTSPFRRSSTIVDTIVITDGQNVNVDGSLILLATSTSTLSLTPGSTAPLNVNGSIVLNGSLVLNLLDRVSDGQLLPIIDGTNINGEFSEVTVSGPRKCEDLKGAQQFTATGVAVLVSVDRSSCHSGLSKVLSGVIVY